MTTETVGSIIFPWMTSKWDTYKEILSSPIKTSEQLEAAIKKIVSVKSAFPSGTVTDVMNTYFNSLPRDHKDKIKETEFYSDILPFIQKLALNAPTIIRKVNSRLLLSSVNSDPRKLVFHRQEVSALLALMFFCLFNGTYRKYSGVQCRFADFSCESMWANKYVNVLEYIINYFAQVYDYRPTSGVILARINMEACAFEKNGTPLSIVAPTKKRTFDTPATYNVVPCETIIGGRVLVNGNSQNEIMMLCAPECLVSLLYCNELCENESVVMSGVSVYSKYSGYGNTFRFDGNCYDVDAPTHTCIFIDVLSKLEGYEQYLEDFDRDLHKACCGFSIVSADTISCENWGKSEFGSNRYIKLLQLTLAAGVFSNNVAVTCDDSEFAQEIKDFNDLIQECNVTVSELYIAYKRVITNMMKKKINLAKVDILGEVAAYIADTK